MKRAIKVLVASGLILGVTEGLMAEENLAVGFQSTGFLSHGLSAKYDVDDKIVAQGILGFFGTLNNYSVRGLYKFKEQDHYNLYGYGSVGMWQWNHHYYEDETTVGFGAGAGAEYDLRGIDSTFIPLFVNIELGMTYANFDNYTYNNGGFGLGLGLHYKF